MSDLTPATTDAPTSGRSDYLRKRRNSEGPRRRKLSKVVQDDCARDTESLRIWRTVHAACLAQIGESPHVDARPGDRTSKGRRASLYRGAALRICNERYEIPAIRLAEFAGVRRQTVGYWLHGTREAEVHEVVKRWETSGGPSAVKLDTLQVSVTRAAAEALAAAALESGEDLTVIASAAILAACSL